MLQCVLLKVLTFSVSGFVSKLSARCAGWPSRCTHAIACPWFATVHGHCHCHGATATGVRSACAAQPRRAASMLCHGHAQPSGTGASNRGRSDELGRSVPEAAQPPEQAALARQARPLHYHRKCSPGRARTSHTHITCAALGEALQPRGRTSPHMAATARLAAASRGPALRRRWRSGRPRHAYRPWWPPGLSQMTWTVAWGPCQACWRKEKENEPQPAEVLQCVTDQQKRVSN